MSNISLWHMRITQKFGLAFFLSFFLLIHFDFSPASFSFPVFLSFASRYLLLVIPFLSVGKGLVLTVQKT